MLSCAERLFVGAAIAIVPVLLIVLFFPLAPVVVVVAAAAFAAAPAEVAVPPEHIGTSIGSGAIVTYYVFVCCCA